MIDLTNIIMIENEENFAKYSLQKFKMLVSFSY